MTRAAALLLLLLASSANAAAPARPTKSIPMIGLLAPDSTYRLLSVGGRFSHYPYIRSWAEMDTIRFVDVMRLRDTTQVDSTASFSVWDYKRVRVVAYRKNGEWWFDLELVR